MKTTRQFTFTLTSLLLLGAALLGAFRTPAPAQTGYSLAPVTFEVRGLAGKCLDFGAAPQVAGSPVFLYGCNGTIAQQVRIVEINARHEVKLFAGTKVIGVKQNILNQLGTTFATAAATTVETEIPLELQSEANPALASAAGQVFALDGDSIIWAANRELVVKVKNARGANRTPLVLGKRELADNEFWHFTSNYGASVRPTKGFVQVSTAIEFVSAIQQAAWGTVIEVAADVNLQNVSTLSIGAGVTIRGNRSGTNLGPELWVPQYINSTLEIVGERVRITGVRLRGPSRSTDSDLLRVDGIHVPDSLKTIIDHNDLSDWTGSAINVLGGDETEACDPRDHRDPRTRPQNVIIVRNFMHHNQRQSGGYGVCASTGGFPFIEGNTFVSNRHAIAADGRAQTGYRALANLVLSDTPWQTKGYVPLWHAHDFDMHGRGDNGFGGVAGQYVEIAGNTFLGTKGIVDRWHENFDLRGEPCNLVEFHHNVSLQSQGDAVACSDCGNGINKLKIFNNQFDSANPTNRLGVGDFDGDGKDDLFLATGAAWYYAPAGNAEWRFINAQTEKTDNLLFGDFDGDGRTDVFTQHGDNWDVSWGGASKWETINHSGARMKDFAIGDFVGDKRADVFFADGNTWYSSDGGVGLFAPLDTSSFRVSDLRFGDFNGDGKTDVFGVVSGNWMVSYSGTSGWTYLRSRLSDSVANLIVADFNGDGRADVTTLTLSYPNSLAWKVSYGGTGNWTTLRTYGQPFPTFTVIGRFNGDRSADMLFWHDNYFDISANGSGTPQRQSRQDMR